MLRHRNNKMHVTLPEKPGDILSAIGNTPLIEIKSLTKILNGSKIFGKCEHLNPGGSVKDRPALRMIEEAEKQGLLKPGYTICEGTGGNTGVGLAMIAAAKGYKAIFAMPESISKEKIDSMKLYGAEVLLCKSVPFTDQEHYFHVAAKLGKEAKCFFTNQFENLANGASHYENTAPEIYRALDGKVDGFATSCGTGGTVNGCSRYFKEQNDKIQVYVIDPLGSGLFDYINEKNNTYKENSLPNTTFIKRSEGTTISEGIGIDRLTENFKAANVDGAFQVTDQEAIEMAYHLLRNDGIFVGPSAALNVCGAVKLARKLKPGSNIVTILCDVGSNYNSKIFDSSWLKEKDLEPKVTDSSINFVF